MFPTPSRRRGVVAPAAALGAVFALALLLRAPVADVPLERDEGEYAYIGQRWLLGEVPYKDSFDQKPPGVFAAYAVIQRCLGDSPAALHWGAQLYSLGTLAALLVLGWRLFTLYEGAIAAALCAFLITAPCVFGNAANTEVFLLLPATVAAGAAWAAAERSSVRWALLAGAAAGAGMLFKQVGLFTLLFCLGWVLWAGRPRLRLAGAVLLGAAAAAAPAVAYFVAVGAGAEFYDCVVGYNLRYASRLPLSRYPASFWASFRVVLTSFWPVFAAAVLGLVSAGAGRSRAAWFAAAWLLSGFLAACTGGHFFLHYYLVPMPAVALLAAAGLSVLAAAFGARARAVLPAALAAAAVLYGAAVTPWYYSPAVDPLLKCRLVYGSGPGAGHHMFAESPELGRFLAERTAPEDTVFILGSEPQVLYYAGRKSASRYIFVYPAMAPFEGGRARQQEILDELDERRPELIVTVLLPDSLNVYPGTPTDLVTGVRRRLEESYQVVAVMPSQDAVNRPLVEGRAARCLWEQSPLWYGATRPWGALTVWQRR